MHGFPVLAFCQSTELHGGTQFAVDLPSIAEDTEVAAEDEGTRQEIEHLHAKDQPAEQAGVPEVAIQTPTPAQRTAIHRAHVNLGHTTKAEFLRALRISGMAPTEHPGTGPGGVMFNGRRVHQLSDYSVQCSMRDYILEKMDPIALPKQTRKGESESKEVSDSKMVAKKFLKTSLNSSQQELMHTINMKFLWCARQARPEVLGTTTYIASTKSSELTIEHLKEAAKTVRHLKQTADMSLTLHSFDPTQVKITVVVDGSPNAKNEPRGQGGSLDLGGIDNRRSSTRENCSLLTGSVEKWEIGESHSIKFGC
eukprot:4260252-Amphidinium_carterae.2